MTKICICWGGDRKFHVRHCICIPIEYVWPIRFDPGDPGPVEKGIEVGGTPIGPEIRALAGIAALKSLRGIGADTQAHLNTAFEHASKALQAKLPEGYAVHMDAG